jgi:hypothetical protein
LQKYLGEREIDFSPFLLEVVSSVVDCAPDVLAVDPTAEGLDAA